MVFGGYRCQNEHIPVFITHPSFLCPNHLVPEGKSNGYNAALLNYSQFFTEYYILVLKANSGKSVLILAGTQMSNSYMIAYPDKLS